MRSKPVKFEQIGQIALQDKHILHIVQIKCIALTLLVRELSLEQKKTILKLISIKQYSTKYKDDGETNGNFCKALLSYKRLLFTFETAKLLLPRAAVE